MVGAAGFEPTTPRPPGECATGLRYAPTDAGYSHAAWPNATVYCDIGIEDGFISRNLPSANAKISAVPMRPVAFHGPPLEVWAQVQVQN